ncbi:MAG: aldo/keto reductase [Clostridia bacterium]|nr:aldo/keto reductase [Clostridia bacterium]MBQ7138219.1 aldo/keto reductase [Clostridia bacterium]
MSKPAPGFYVPAADRYDTMQYARCGKSGLKLPRVSLGMWNNFGSVNVHENSRQMLLTAFDLGITHIDLANNYGPLPGSAEETFGRVLSSDLRAHRDELCLSTKAGYDMWKGPYGDWGSRKYLISSLDHSLKRMKVDYVDIFYHHRPDPETPLDETMGALADIIRQGKALYVGVSNYSAEQTARAADILKSMGVPLTIHQPRYNMLDRWVEAGSPSLCDVLLERGIGAAVFSPLAQGLLTDRYLDGIPADSRAGGPCVFLNANGVTESILVKVRALNAIAAARGETMAQLALAWVLENPAITSVIIGASRPAQIVQNVQTIQKHVPLTDEEKAAINTILNEK